MKLRKPNYLFRWMIPVILTIFVIMPLFTEYFDNPFFLDVITRILILSIAACSLNLILGYGGLISFGHAAYIGIGAYAVGIPAFYENNNGLFQLGIAILGSAIFALITGLVTLRTRGVYFIMITLAFAQMIYFAFVSIEKYGGDDGLVINSRSDFSLFFDLESPITFYYFVLVSLMLTLLFTHRIVHSRFGMVIRGAKSNNERMQSIGYPTFNYQLICYVISGVLCGIAGWMLGNFTYFISPEMMDWTRSGELIFMVVLGGIGSIFGPVLGTTLFVLLEEYLSEITIYWQIIFGTFLIIFVLRIKGGIYGLFAHKE